MYQVTFLIGRQLFVMNMPRFITAFIASRYLPHARLWDVSVKNHPQLCR